MSGASAIRYFVEGDGLVDGTALVEDFRCVERLDEVYALEVVAACSLDQDPAALLGSDLTLVLERKGFETRRLPALVWEVEEGQLNYETANRRLRLQLRPALACLSLTRNNRIFQDKSAVEILEEVLGETLRPYGRQVQLDAAETTPTREFCLQYQETDLEFVERLLAEEGIAYGFDFAGEVEMLVLRDANRQYPEAPTGRGRGQAPYVPSDADIDAEEPIHRIEVVDVDTVTSVVVADWDWTRTEMPFSAEARSEDGQRRDRESYQHGEGRSLLLVDYAPAAYGADDAERQAPLRLEAELRDRRAIQGLSRIIGLTAGSKLEVVGHPIVGVDGAYLVIEVEHHSRPWPAPRAAAPADAYHNRFTAIPFDTPYRPRPRRGKRSIPGIQTALVTGPSGEEIHLDEHGRIKIQFHWDRVAPGDETSSCWVRVQQPWAGAGWGHYWIPRIGMEVVVHFMDGDPDRPLVTGSVYNGANALPYPLPGEKTKSTIKSNSSPGGDGFNEWRFEDKAGEEQVFTHAQKDYNEVVLNDHNTVVHGNQTNTVDVDQTQTVHGNQTEQIDIDQTMTVSGNRTVHVKGDFSENVDGTETRSVTGDVTETFDGNETRSVGANLTETIAVGETRDIGGDQKESIGASQTVDIGAASTVTVTGSMTLEVGAGMSTSTPANHTQIALGGMSVSTPAKVTWIGQAGITLICPGGLTQIDNFEQWVGGFMTDIDVLGKAFFATSTEITGFATGMTGTKLEANGVVSSNVQINLTQRAARLFNDAADVDDNLSVILAGIQGE
jgi:type VI secretion system secreted protein VgrG